MSKRMVIWLLLGFVGLWIASQLFKASVFVEGDTITIDKAGHHIEGVLAPEERYEFILMNVEAAFNTFAGDGFFTMLPLSEAQILKTQYGDDFLQKDSPGAAEVKKHFQPSVLLAKDAPAKTMLSEVQRLIKQDNNPVFAFYGSRIAITRHTYLKMAVNDDSGAQFYFIRACEIIKPNYQ